VTPKSHPCKLTVIHCRRIFRVQCAGTISLTVALVWPAAAACETVHGPTHPEEAVLEVALPITMQQVDRIGTHLHWIQAQHHVTHGPHSDQHQSNSQGPNPNKFGWEGGALAQTWPQGGGLRALRVKVPGSAPPPGAWNGFKKVSVPTPKGILRAC
jgi:hypothetical protein